MAKCRKLHFLCHVLRCPLFLEVCRLAPEHLTQLQVDYLFSEWLDLIAVWIGPKNCLPNSGWWNLLTTVNAAWFSWLPTCRRFHNFKLPSWFLGAFSLNFPQDYYFKDYNNKLKPIKFKFIFAFLAGENCLFCFPSNKLCVRFIWEKVSLLTQQLCSHRKSLKMIRFPDIASSSR